MHQDKRFPSSSVPYGHWKGKLLLHVEYLNAQLKSNCFDRQNGHGAAGRMGGEPGP